MQKRKKEIKKDKQTCRKERKKERKKDTHIQTHRHKCNKKPKVGVSRVFVLAVMVK